MKKKFTNIVVFLAVLLGVVIGMPVWSQNLVVNPSFENTSSCPIGISEFSKALNWSPVNSGADTCSSPDLYAACAPNIGGANSPNALIGFQNSRTGSHHAGIILYEGVALFGCNPLFSSQYREYIEGQVSSPLVAGQKYCVKFYVSLANCKWGSDDIGIYFTNTLAQYNFCNNDAPLPVTPQLNWCSAAVLETEDWVELRWTYTANGGENYFVIGNFKNDNNTSIEDNNCSSIHSYAYYFIDDVSITPGCCPVDMAFTNIVQPTCGSNNGSINLGVANSPICGENGSVSYLWSNGATTKNVANLAAGTYTVTVTNQGGCTATLSTVLNNGGCCPTVVTINTTAATCGANNGSISAVVSNNPVAPSYLWLNNATTASVSNVPPGTYTVTVTTGAGCVVTASGTVVSSTAPTPPVIPPQNVCNIASTTLNAGNGYSGYAWSASNGGTISSATNAQGIIVTSSGTYTVVVTAANGCTASTQTTVVINTLTASASANNPCIGGVLTLSATGPAGATYSWAGSNGASSSQQNPSINNVTAANSGTYTVTVTGTNGCTASAQTTVSIGTSITPTFNPISAFCSGTAAPTLPNTSNNGIAGTWLPTVVSNTASGTYSFTPNAGQCATTASLSVTVNPSVTPTFTPIPAFCSGITAPSLPSTSNNGIAGTWLPTVVSNTTSGTYNFTPNAGQCASAAAVTTTVNPSVTPTFTPIPAFCSGTAAPTLPNTSNNGIAGTWLPATISNTTSGTYSFTPNVGQCASVATVTTTVNALPNLSVTTSCGAGLGTGSIATTANTSAGGVLSYAINGVADADGNETNLNNGSYTVLITENPSTCTTAQTVSVNCNCPAITIAGALSICQNTAATYTQTGGNAGGQWTVSPSGAGAVDANGNFVPSGGFSGAASISYAANGCTGNLSININPLTTPAFTPIPAFCSGTAASTLPSTSNNGIAGTWSPATVSNTTSGTYSFTPNAGQCASTASLSVTVNALPNLNVQTSCGAGLGTGSIVTTANALAGGTLNYAINGVADADGNQTSLNNGSYTVLITENPSTCTTAQTVSVNCNCPSIVVNGALSICQNTAATYTQTGGNAGGQWSVSPSGAGAVDANGNFVPSGGFSGAASISYAANDCTGNLSISINPLNTPIFTPIPAFCSGMAAPSLPSTSNNGIVGTWLPTVVSNTTSGTYNFTPNAGQCASAVAVTTTVNPSVTPIFTPIPAFCSGTAAPSLPSTSNNGIAGTWSPTVVSNTTSGTYNFTPNAGQCASAAAVTTTVNPSVTPTFTPIPAFCSGTAAPSLPSTSNNGIAGTWSPTTISNATSGIYNFTPNAGQCASVASLSVAVNALPNLSVTTSCGAGLGTGSVATTANASAGGVLSYAINGVADADGNETSLNNGTYTVLITENPSTCTTAQTVSVNCNCPSIVVNGALSICQNTAATYTQTGGNAGGQWAVSPSGAGTVDANGNFVPSGGFSGAASISYAANGCTGNLSININPLTTPTFTPIPAFCSGTTAPSLPNTSNNGITGTWSPTTINNTISGTYNFTPNAGQCASAAAVTTTVNALPNLSVQTGCGAGLGTGNIATTANASAGGVLSYAINGVADADGNETNLNNGTYTVLITENPSACTATQTVSVNCNCPTITIAGALSICQNTAATYTQTGGNAGGQWSVSPSGAGTVDANGNFVPSGGFSGAASISYAANGCTGNLSISINPLNTPTFTPIPAFCSGTAAPSLPSTSNNGIAGTWLPATISNTTSGTYNFTPNAGQCASTAAVTTTVNPSVTPTFTPILAFCSGTTAPSLPSTSNNGIAGTWSPATVSNTTSGTYSFTPNAGQCASTASLSVTVNPSVSPTFTPIPAFCSGTAAPTLPSTSNNGIAGTWLPTTINNTTSGTYNFTPNAGQCASATSLTVTVNPSVTPTFTPISAFCSGTAAPSLPSTSNNGIAGTWLPTVVSNTTSGTYNFTPNAGQCASAAAVTTTVNPSVTPTFTPIPAFCSGTAAPTLPSTSNNGIAGTWLPTVVSNTTSGTYNFTPNAGQCASTATVTTTVNPSVTPIFTPISAFCSGTAAPTLPNTSNNGIAGTWLPTVVSNTASGTYSFTPNAGQCATTASLSVTVNPSVTPTFTPIPAFCSGITAPSLPSTSNNGIAGTWLPTVVSNTTSGTYNFTPNAGQCASATSLSVTVNPSTTPTFNPIPAFCSGTVAPTLPNTSNNGIVGTWLPTVVSNTTSGTYNFTPNAGQCASATSLSVTVNPSITPTFTPILAFCSGTAASTLPSTSNNGIAGTWSPATVSNTTSGTYSFTPNAGQCASVASLSVTVNALPNLSVTTSCGAGLGTGSITTAANASAGGALSYAINGVADADGNETSLNNGTYTVLITENPSTCTTAQTVSVNCNCPSIVVNGALSICQNTAATYTQTGGNAGGQWAVSPSGAGAVDANGNFVPSGGFSGAASISYAANGCTGNLSININPLTTPTFTPIPAFCSGTTAPSLPNTSNNGITGTWSPTTISNTASSTYNFTPNAGQCASNASLSMTVNPSVTPTFTPILAFCSGTAAPSLPSTSNNGVGGTWLPATVSNTTSGTYNFTPNAEQCASAAVVTTTVNALPNLNVQTSCGAGLGTGSVATTANASAGGVLSYAINGVADADGNETSLNNGTYTVLITENPSTCTTAQTVSVNCNCPSIVVNGALSICQNTAATYTQTGGNAGGQWAVSPSGAGAVDANGNFVPSGGFSGAASISYAANGCTGNLSININPLTTPTFNPIPAFCSGTTAPSLPNTSNNGITGTWSPTTISNTASGTYNFTPNAGQCASNASLSMTVNPSVTPTFTPILAFCSGTAAPSLPSTSNNGVGGTWLPATVSNTTSGTYNFTPNAEQCASAAVVTTTVNALPNLNVQTSCGAGLGTGSVATTANASAGGVLSYAINGVADADGNETSLNNGTYTVLITGNPSTCTTAQTVSVNCNCPSIVVNGALSICQNTAATYTQTGGNAGGQWAVSPSGAGAVDANGNFVPSGGFSGAASISYAANGCTGNLSININPLTTPTFNPIPAFCSGTTAPSLPNTSNNGIVGTWLPTTISNATSGIYNFTPNAGQCASVASLSVAVNALPNLSVTTSCGAGLGTGSVATTANASAGGVLSYAINGVADADGNQTNLNNGTYTVLITENPSTCTAAQTVSVNCNCPSIVVNGALSICQNTAATYTQTGGNAGGQWAVSPSGAGAVDANGNFVPSGGFSGAASISYAANGCTGNLSININPLTTPTFNPIPAFCSGTAAPTLPSTSNNGIAGTWSPTTISNTTSGTYNFTPNAGQCASAVAVTTTVNASPNFNVQTSCAAGLGTGSVATTANASAGGALSYTINGVADADGNETNLNNGTYTVLITENPSTCTAAQTVSVNCNCPTITIAGAASICQNATATNYTQTGGNVGGQWTVSPSGAGAVDANGVFTPSGGFSGAASISYTANGCTGNLSININPLNTPTFTPIPAFCSGTTAPTLPSTSNNGISGTWSPTVVSNTTSGTYNFTPNAGQCASAASLSVAVNALPNLSVTTSCGAGLGTGSVATTANASAGGVLSYAINGVADADGNETSLNNGTYTVLITENPSACTAAQTVSVNCNCPSIVVNGALSICQNTAATYTQTGGNAGGQWSVSPSGAGAVDANGNFVPSGGFSGAASISYAANGCTGNLSININPLTTPTFNPIPAFCSGTVAPSLPSTSNNGIAGTWSPTTISNTTSGTYNFTPNAGQCASVASLSVAVNALPNLSVQTSCGAGLGTGSIATTANTSAGGALSYAINGVADADGNQTSLNNGSYTVLITENPSTCTAAQTVSVNCNCPSIVVNGALSICQNTTATYTQTGGNAGGQWSVSPSGAGAVDANGNFVPSGGFSGAASISYAANGCTGNLSININPLTTPTFTPIPAFCSGMAAPTLPSTSNNGIVGTWLPTTISNTTSGTYNFTPNAGQCASVATVTTTVNALPNLSVLTDCGTNPSNGSGMLTITASVPDGSALEYAIDGVNFQASNVFSNLNNEAYIVTVRAISTSCIATASTNISCACIAPTLTLSSPNPICQNATGNATISLSNNLVNTTGTPPNYYSTLALANIGGMGDVVNPDAVGAGTYFVRSNNATDSTCFSIEPITVVINNLPTPSIEGMQNYCVGDAASALSANGGISYVWNNGTTENTLMPSTNNAANTTYTVTVTDANTCQNTAEITVNVSEVSVVLSGNTLIELGDSTTLHATAITLPNSTLSYTWLPTGLCQDTDCSSITVSPNINGIYSVTVSNEWGCLATDNISLQVTTQNTLVIPNAFSPNGDNVNEVFHIGGTNIAQFELLIYDRWGQKTFETQSVDLADGWDGKYPNGIDAELAVYVYYLNVTFSDGKTQFAKGNVTLVR